MNYWLLVILLFVIALYVSRWHSASAVQKDLIRGDVLLVFAHPDDEAMFFSPLLSYLRRRGITCHFLCLSNGNANGLGSTRELELYQSAHYFGVHKKNVRIVQHCELDDGLSSHWPAHIIKAEVSKYLEAAMHIGTVITFDNQGVSHHPNHIAVYNGVKKLKDNMPPGIAFMQLASKNVLLKYSGCLSMLFSLIASPRHTRSNATILIPPGKVFTSFSAMRRHWSQMVWFRYLFVFFSSYTYVNELSEIA